MPLFNLKDSLRSAGNSNKKRLDFSLFPPFQAKLFRVNEAVFWREDEATFYTSRAQRASSRALIRKKCGTVIGGYTHHMAFLNRNAVFNQDGTPYIPAKPVINMMKKHASDPDKVPETYYTGVMLIGLGVE